MKATKSYPNHPLVAFNDADSGGGGFAIQSEYLKLSWFVYNLLQLSKRINY